MFKHMAKEGSYRARPWRFSLLVVGGLALLIGVALLAWSLLLRPPTRPSPPAVQYSPPQPPIALSEAYEDAVKQSLAQQLLVSVSQLAHETQTNQDALFGVADAHRLSQEQLHTMLLTAFQSASEQMASRGQWTQQQTSAEMQYWQQREFKALVGDVSSWLLR